MDIKVDVKLFSWQIDLWKQIDRYPHDVHVVRSKRQVGKSTVAELIILKFALEKRKSTNYYLSPTYRQARKVFEDIANIVRDTAPVQKINNADMNIRFKNGSTISFFSGEQSIESLQGYVCTGIFIIDEAAYINDDVYYACAPYTDVHRAPTLIISTPVFKSGWYYNMYTAGESGEEKNVHSISFCDYDTSMLLTPEKLAFYKANLPRIKFIQQYLGEFADSTGDVFGDFSELLMAKTLPTDQMEIYMGCDWSSGVGEDETAISIWDKKSSREIDLVHFSDKDATQTINYIIQLIKHYKPKKIQVELNSMGRTFYDFLRKEINNQRLDTQVVGFSTTNESKEKIVNKLQVAIQNKTVKLLDDKKLITQMSAFEARQMSNGKVQYGNKKDSIHDDLVMATLLGYDIITKNNYAIL